jgi:thiol-disulfide isomerase/thioredoxin
MGRIGSLYLFVSVVLVLCSTCESRGDAWGTNQQAAAPPRIAWFRDLYEAHKRSVETGRPMLIVFGADWCHYCREMDSTTLRNPDLTAYITTNFIPVHLDTERDRRVAEILKAKPIPCTIVLSPDAELLGRIIGFQDPQPYFAELEKTRQHYFQLLRKRAR